MSRHCPACYHAMEPFILAMLWKCAACGLILAHEPRKRP